MGKTRKIISWKRCKEESLSSSESDLRERISRKMKKIFAFSLLALFIFSSGLWAASISGPAGLFIQIGDSIDELGDVDTTGKVSGSCFIYDATSGNWEAATCPSGGGGGSSTLQVAIGSVEVTSPTVSVNFSSHVFTASQNPSGTANIGINSSSVTLMGNTFNAANVLVKLSGSALIPNALIDPSSVTKLGGSIALGSETTGNYVASLVAGLGITVGSAGVGSTPTVTFTPSLVTGNQTFGANNTSNITWCFGIIGTDPCFTFSDDLITVTNLTVSDTLTAENATITNLTAGGVAYPTGDGSANQVIATDGSGTLSFMTLGTGSSLGVSEGGVLISSPTSNIDFSSHTFNVDLVGGTTAMVTLNNSSVTLLGPSIDLGVDTTGDYVSSITVTFPLLGNTSGHIILDIDRSSFTLLGPSIDSDELPLHSGAHEAGEIDEIDVTGLSGLLADPQTVIISTDGTVVHTSSGINFVPGSNVTITGEANGAFTDITIAASGTGGGGYAMEPATVTIQAAEGIIASTITVSTLTFSDGTYLTSTSTIGGLPGGSDTQIQFNDGGSLGGDSNLTWDKTLDHLSSTGTFHLSDGSDYIDFDSDLVDPLYGLSWPFVIRKSGFSTFTGMGRWGFGKFSSPPYLSYFIMDDFNFYNGTVDGYFAVQGSTAAGSTFVPRMKFIRSTDKITIGYHDPTEVEKGTVTASGFRDKSIDCSGYDNGGALTTDGSGNFVCSDDDSGTGGGSGVSSAYGALYLSSSSATQADISTTPVKLAIFETEGESNLTIPSAANDEITISTDGAFFVYASVISSGTSEYWAERFYLQLCINDVPTSITGFSWVRPVITIGGVLSLDKDDVVSLYISQSSTTLVSAYFLDAQLVVSAIGGVGGGGGSDIYIQDGGSPVVQTSTVNFSGDQFIVTDDGDTALVTIDQSSVAIYNASGYINNNRLDTSSITKAGNAFGGNNQLCQLNGTAYVPDANLSPSVSLLGSQIDIGDETNLSVDWPIKLDDDTVSISSSPVFNEVTVGTMTVTSSMTVNGPVTFNGDVTINGTDTMTLDTDVTITTLTVTGAFSVNGQSLVTQTSTSTIVVPISAASLAGTLTSGGGPVSTYETTTNKVNIDYFPMSYSTTQYFEFSYSPPNGWDEGTVTYYVVWTATESTGGVAFDLQGLCRSNDDALDTAYGTAQEVTDTLITAGDTHMTSASSALTIGGTCAEGDYVTWRGYRNVVSGSDTLAAKAMILEIRLKYTRNSYSD